MNRQQKWPLKKVVGYALAGASCVVVAGLAFQQWQKRKIPQPNIGGDHTFAPDRTNQVIGKVPDYFQTRFADVTSAKQQSACFGINCEMNVDQILYYIIVKNGLIDERTGVNKVPNIWNALQKCSRAVWDVERFDPKMTPTGVRKGIDSFLDAADTCISGWESVPCQEWETLKATPEFKQYFPDLFVTGACMSVCPMQIKRIHETLMRTTRLLSDMRTCFCDNNVLVEAACSI